MSDQSRMSLHMVMKHLGEGHFILVDNVPISSIELLKRRFQTSLDISFPKKLIGKSHRPKNKTFIRGARHDVPFEL